ADNAAKLSPRRVRAHLSRSCGGTDAIDPPIDAVARRLYSAVFGLASTERRAQNPPRGSALTTSGCVNVLPSTVSLTGNAPCSACPPRPRPPPPPPPPPPPAPRPPRPLAAGGGVPRRSQTHRCIPAVPGSGSPTGAHTVCTCSAFGSRGCGR